MGQFMSQVLLQKWCEENNLTPGKPLYSAWASWMKWWDRSFRSYWDGGTYDKDILQTMLDYAKENPKYRKV